MKLYGHPLSSCTRKALMTCAEKGAAIDLVTVDLFAGDHKREPHVTRQPFGVIPVLGDYLEEAGVARHNTARVASDLVQLAPSAGADRKRPSAGKA